MLYINIYIVHVLSSGISKVLKETFDYSSDEYDEKEGGTNLIKESKIHKPVVNNNKLANKITCVYVPNVSLYVDEATIDNKGHFVILEKSIRETVRLYHPTGKILVHHLRDYLTQHYPKQPELRFEYRFYINGSKKEICREEYEFPDNAHIKFVRKSVSKHHKKTRYMKQARKFRCMSKVERDFIIKYHRIQKEDHAKKRQNYKFTTKNFYSLSKDVTKSCKLVDTQVDKQLAAEKKRKKNSTRNKQRKEKRKNKILLQKQLGTYKKPELTEKQRLNRRERNRRNRNSTTTQRQKYFAKILKKRINLLVQEDEAKCFNDILSSHDDDTSWLDKDIAEDNEFDTKAVNDDDDDDYYDNISSGEESMYGEPPPPPPFPLDPLYAFPYNYPPPPFK